MDTAEESATNLKQGIAFDLITNIAATPFNEELGWEGEETVKLDPP